MKNIDFNLKVYKVILCKFSQGQINNSTTL